jgi:methylase of polypeptide subunit release factors
MTGTGKQKHVAYLHAWSIERLDPLALGDALRAHGPRVRAVLGSLVRVGQRLDDALRTPSRIWHARRSDEPAAVIVRLFVLRDRVTALEVEGALGEVGHALRDADVLFDDSGHIASRVQLAMSSDAMCFGDWLGPGAILPLGGATMELARVAGHQPMGRALDLGCGAGAVAMAMARVATRVVATDIDARAAAFTRFNARLNRIENIDVREGDLFEPVRGERFDRIAVQPPFHALRPDALPAAFVHGGVRGDELALEIIARAPEHLETTGTLLLLADWPMHDGQGLAPTERWKGLASRVHVEGARVLVLRSPNKDLDEYCTLHAASEHAPNAEPDAFSNAVIAQREHLEALGVHGIALAWVVLRRDGRGWASEISVKHPHDAPMTWEHVSRIFAAHDAAHAPDAELLTARLAKPEGARWVEQTVGTSEPAVVAHPPAGRPEWPCVLDASFAASTSALVSTGHPRDATEMAAARRALLMGALDVLA